MALRASSPSSDGVESNGQDGFPGRASEAGQDAQLAPSLSARVQPGTREKRWSAIVAVALIVLSMFLPWWQPSYPLRNAAAQLVGGQVLGVGLGFGSWPALTGMSTFGNFLWGAVPTLVVLLLGVLLLVRVAWPRLLQGRVIATWAVFALLTQGWFAVVGWTQTDAALGQFPVLWGMLPATMASVFSTVTLFGWWVRGERDLWPTRRATPSSGSAPAAAASDADSPADDAEHLFGDFTDTPAKNADETDSGRT